LSKLGLKNILFERKARGSLPRSLPHKGIFNLTLYRSLDITNFAYIVIYLKA
jgi:hypothetical protein